jgi:hypothetical protein
LSWSTFVRAWTDKGKPVYLCPHCKTPVERTWRRFKATPAAAAAFRLADKSIVKFDEPVGYFLTRPRPLERAEHPATTYDGLLPALADDGSFWLFEWPDDGLDEELATGWYAVSVLSAADWSGVDPELAGKAPDVAKRVFLKRGGLPEARRAVVDWDVDLPV